MKPSGFLLSSDCEILTAPHVCLGSQYVRLGTSPVTSVKPCNAVACYSARSEVPKKNWPVAGDSKPQVLLRCALQTVRFAQLECRPSDPTS